MLSAAGLLFTYVVSSLALFLVTARLTQATDRDAPRLLFLTAGLGPIAISLWLTRLYQFFPGHGDAFYVSLVVAPFLVACVACRREWPLLPALLRQARAEWSRVRFREHWPVIVVVATVAGLWALVTADALLFPLTGNDPLGYTSLCRLMYRYKAVAFYPLEQADPTTGFYFPSYHPLGYPSLIVWGHLLQGTAESAGFMRVIAPVYMLHTLALLWHLLSARGPMAGPVAMLLLVATPLYYGVTRICHTDPLRVYAFLLAFVWLGHALARPGRAWLLLSGACLGLCLHSHSTGLLALPMSLLIYFVKAQQPLKRRLLHLGVIGATALAVGGPRYAQNVVNHGNPLRNKVAAMELAQVDLSYYLARDREVASPSGKLINGYLKGFCKLDDFGLAYWVFAAAMVFGLRQARGDALSSIFLWVIAVWYALAALTVAVGIDIMILNDRYALAVHPFVAYHAALFLGRLYERLAGIRNALFLLACTGLTFPFRTLPKRSVERVAHAVASRGAEDIDVLASWRNTFEPLHHAARTIPEGAVCLVFRMNEFAYYVNRKLISSWDPRMVDVYTQRDKDGTYQALRRLGVDYIYLPNYTLPTVANTQVFRVLADAGMCEIVSFGDGFRLVKLLATRQQVRYEPMQILNADFSRQEDDGPGPAWWTLYGHGSDDFDASAIWRLEADDAGRSALVLETGRRTQIRLYAGYGAYRAPPSAALWNGRPFDGRIDPTATYRFRARIAGEARFAIDILPYTARGELMDAVRLWHGVVDRELEEGHGDIECLFRLPPATAQYRVSFYVRSPDWLSIQSVAVDRACRLDSRRDSAPVDPTP